MFVVKTEGHCSCVTCLSMLLAHVCVGCEKEFRRETEAPSCPGCDQYVCDDLCCQTQHLRESHKIKLAVAVPAKRCKYCRKETAAVNKNTCSGCNRVYCDACKPLHTKRNRLRRQVWSSSSHMFDRTLEVDSEEAETDFMLHDFHPRSDEAGFVDPRKRSRVVGSFGFGDSF